VRRASSWRLAGWPSGGSLLGVDLRRLSASDWAAGFFGAALIGLLWAPWYQSFTGGGPAGAIVTGKGWTAYAPLPTIHVGTFNGWQAMAVNDVIFLIAGLLGLWLVVATATHSTAAVPIAAAVFAGLVGLVACVLAIVRVIWPPDLGPGPTSRGAGVWLAMDAAIGLTLTAFASLHSERRGEGVEIPTTTLPAPQI
jgi:hypothetical protein